MILDMMYRHYITIWKNIQEYPLQKPIYLTRQYTSSSTHLNRWVYPQRRLVFKLGLSLYPVLIHRSRKNFFRFASHTLLLKS